MDPVGRVNHLNKFLANMCFVRVGISFFQKYGLNTSYFYKRNTYINLIRNVKKHIQSVDEQNATWVPAAPFSGFGNNNDNNKKDEKDDDDDDGSGGNTDGENDDNDNKDDTNNNDDNNDEHLLKLEEVSHTYHVAISFLVNLIQATRQISPAAIPSLHLLCLIPKHKCTPVSKKKQKKRARESILIE